MRPRSLAVAAVVIIVAAVCVRLGFWQLSRLEQKRHLNSDLRRALSLPAVVLIDPRQPADALLHRRVRMSGTYDESRQVLLAGRAHEGAPGVHVVTPLVMAGGSVAVLVDRGWLAAADAATARPQDASEPGPREVTGIADTLPRGASRYATRTIASDSVTVYSTLRLDLDSLSGRFPYALANLFVRELPSPELPPRPVRELPRPYDETMHLSYAIQWFAFATILLVGSIVLSVRRHRLGVPEALVPMPDETPGRHPA